MILQSGYSLFCLLQTISEKVWLETHLSYFILSAFFRNSPESWQKSRYSHF